MPEPASASMPAPSPFDAAYGRGVWDAEPPPTAPSAGELGARVRMAPLEPVAIAGTVLTPAEVLDPGYVVVDGDGLVAAVQAHRPEGVRVVDTGAVVLPGLIDLHGHPEFNVFSAWEPPRLFANRYAWRGSEVYRALVRDPQNRLLGALPAHTQLRYAEVRALVGGVTAIQGASGRSRHVESLVRNVDLRVFGDHRARSAIDLPAESSRDLPRFRKVVEQIAAGQVTAFYVHLAEGRADDPRSARELDRLVELGGLTPATVLIHGTALTRDDFEQVAASGAKLVWSPQSNLRLYGQTTDAAAALEAGVPVALGADWLPSGSTSLLAELRVARRVLASQGAPADARDLVRMVTDVAAGVAGLGDRLGTLAPGRPADVVVLERVDADPWESVLRSDPAMVELVLIGGDVVYGRADLVTTLTATTDTDRWENLLAWGKPMLLDTRGPAATGDETPTLAGVRAALIEQYPQIGPILA